MEPVLIAALLVSLGLLVVAVGAVGFLAYRLSAARARLAADTAAARRAAEQSAATQVAAAQQAAAAQVQQAQAEVALVKQQTADYLFNELNTRTAAAQQTAQTQLQAWRAQELEAARAQLAVVAQDKAQNDLAQWMAASEDGIRQDAINRSRAVISGKVTEHFVPYLPDFPFNPKDARFIGSPVDLIVFDGLDEGAVRRVVLIEVKTGSSALSPRERRVRDAVLAGHVEWLELRPKLDFTATLTPSPDGNGVSIALTDAEEPTSL